MKNYYELKSSDLKKYEKEFGKTSFFKTCIKIPLIICFAFYCFSLPFFIFELDYLFECIYNHFSINYNGLLSSFICLFLSIIFMYIVIIIRNIFFARFLKVKYKIEY